MRKRARRRPQSLCRFAKTRNSSPRFRSFRAPVRRICTPSSNWSCPNSPPWTALAWKLSRQHRWPSPSKSGLSRTTNFAAFSSISCAKKPAFWISAAEAPGFASTSSVPGTTASLASTGGPRWSRFSSSGQRTWRDSCSFAPWPSRSDWIFPTERLTASRARPCSIFWLPTQLRPRKTSSHATIRLPPWSKRCARSRGASAPVGSL